METVVPIVFTTFHEVLLYKDGKLFCVHNSMPAYYGIAWSDEHLYILSRNGQKGEILLILDSSFREIESIHLGRDCNSHQMRYHNGELYYTDTASNRVEIINLESKTSKFIPVGNDRCDFNHLNGLTIESNKLWVCGGNNRLIVHRDVPSVFFQYDLESLKLIDSFDYGDAAHNYLDGYMTSSANSSIKHPDGRVWSDGGWIRGLDICGDSLCTSKSVVSIHSERGNNNAGNIIVLDKNNLCKQAEFEVLSVGQICDVLFINNGCSFWTRADLSQLKKVTYRLNWSKSMRKLEIGSGNLPLPGYEHLDIDANCPDVDYVCSMDEIPVEDNSFIEICSIHSIEHIGWRKLSKTLAEWYRVLEPGGKVHIATPNLKFICEAYLQNDKVWYEDLRRMRPEEKEHIVLNGFHCHSLWANFKLYSSGAGGDEHMACFDAFTMKHALSVAGFISIKILDESDSLIMEGYKA
jgi:predicted SAM-dependent methyltransferase